MSITQTVQEAKRYGVFGCDQHTTLRNAAKRMVEEDISSLVVVDEDGYLAGIITRTDLMRLAITITDWEIHPVKNFMMAPVVTAPPEATLEQVAELMLKKQIHRIVVVRDEGGRQHPLSVVSDADILYHMVNG
jgi:CBS domain-containing protein